MDPLARAGKVKAQTIRPSCMMDTPKKPTGRVRQRQRYAKWMIKLSH